MRAIIIAAGMGNRMGELTRHRPKCLLPVLNTTLLGNTLSHFKQHGIDEVTLIVGHQKEKIDLPYVHFVENPDYPNNNILHSLMKAHDLFCQDLVIAYSDIWLDSFVVENLLAHEGDFVVSVDKSWKAQYQGRTDHPLSEAENVIYNSQHHALSFGKHLEEADVAPEQTMGEFIGLFKLSKAQAIQWANHFEQLCSVLSPDQPFQNAKRFKKSYLTDFFNARLAEKANIQCALHDRGWFEIDTLQDYHNLLTRMESLAEHVV